MILRNRRAHTHTHTLHVDRTLPPPPPPTQKYYITSSVIDTCVLYVRVLFIKIKRSVHYIFVRWNDLGRVTKTNYKKYF